MLLPPPVMDTFGVRFGVRSVMDVKLAWRMFSLWRQTWPSSRIAHLMCDDMYGYYIAANNACWCNKFVLADGDARNRLPSSLDGHLGTDETAEQFASTAAARATSIAKGRACYTPHK